ncbi:hypothetical protein J2129_001757 [Methanofollis sp. W23]|uniref:hypothetical protein n=1 Tax=Methanofollis sp. W23 TaxID=2817849 RepID=UPI001AE48C73|nr:hypothetical protein [Methanofollis sp. W23]MBP2146303.1 hypothetical protein [Methanofollis sp. W23]
MMRRVYYRFPTRFDLNFSLMVPFPQAIRAIAALHRTHTNRREDGNLFKHHIILEIADDHTHFLPVDLLSGIEDMVTESADFRFSVHETLLRPEGRVPVSENVFLLRVVDRGPQSEVFVVKEGTAGSLDALDVRDLLRGTCE